MGLKQKQGNWAYFVGLGGSPAGPGVNGPVCCCLDGWLLGRVVVDLLLGLNLGLGLGPKKRKKIEIKRIK